MNKKMSKRQRDLKAKLMAAIAMLLVSSIMMVSTTYAWFTLSTAPEVTGITTAVGANGNLEMALIPDAGDLTAIKTSVGDSELDVAQRNETWGNLVDLSSTTVYGLDKINLYPSELNIVGGKINTANMLSYPEYGADGRIKALNKSGAVYGEYDSATSQFVPSTGNDYGVRAIGAASGMTDRQLTYRSALNLASSYKSEAAAAARKSLENNGSGLAGIAVKYGAKGGAATFDDNDKTSIQKLLTDLSAENGPFYYMEESYRQFILAMGTSNKSTLSDELITVFVNEVEDENKTLEDVLNWLEDNGVTLDAKFTSGIDKMTASYGKVTAAQTKLTALTGGTYTWTQISPILTDIANPSEMMIGSKTPEQFKAAMDQNKWNELFAEFTGGIKIKMKPNSGVYADIADQTENYQASVTIENGNVGSMDVSGMTVTMMTVAEVSYLGAVGTYMSTETSMPSGTTSEVVPISDMYGYVVDMAFRTNAANSKLLLQPDATNRIYNGQEGVEMEQESTMGNGASMTFKAAGNFSTEQMLNLMDSITVAFYETKTGDVIGYAKLHTDSYTTNADGIKVKLGMAQKSTEAKTEQVEVANKINEAGITYTVYYTDLAMKNAQCRSYETTVTENGATNVVVKWEKYEEKTVTQQKTENGQPVVDEDNNPVMETITTYWQPLSEKPTITTVLKTYPVGSWEFKTGTDSNVIMELPQNTPVALSALVYLDGNTVTNADVASSGTSSMTGKMSLQFSSDASLDAMNYTPLMEQGTDAGNTSGGGSTPAEPTPEPEQGGGEETT